MRENKVNDISEGLEKFNQTKKVVKRDISRVISMQHFKKRFDQKGISFQIGTTLLAAFLLILLSVSIFTQTVSAKGAPVASFSASPLSGCSPLTVTFTDSSGGNGYTITKWDWDFNGDGTIERTDATKPSPFTYIYGMPGTYIVTLKVTTSQGTNTMTKTSYITAYGPPAADFTATATSGCAPLTVTFTNTANRNGQAITSRNWDFGDATTYNGQTPPAHVYPSAGYYAVKLTVTTTCGTNTKTKAHYITVYGPPTADFIATATSGCAPLTVTFSDTSNGNGPSITGWNWDFGDSTTYSGQTPPAHIYSNPGTYAVKLTVTTTCGLNTKIAQVVVSSLPHVVPGTYGPTCVAKGNITLGGTPAGGNWSGDGITGNTFNPAAAGPGDHVLTYQYTNNNICSVSKTTILTVLPLPQTTITIG